MRRHERPSYGDPLDLLRRFIPTPLKAVYRIGPFQVKVQTNDFALLPALPSEAICDVPVEQAFEWKLIRDVDSSGLLGESTYLRAQALTIVAMGTACLLGFDHGRRELLGFIGADVDTRTYREFVVPLLCRITTEEVSAESSSTSIQWGEEVVND
jgi:hypothetical protein